MHHNDAFDYVETLIVMSSANMVYIAIEDANKRKWYGDKSNAKSQGAGAIKVICGFWKEWARHFAHDHKINIEFIHPLRSGTKWDAKKFSQVTGWDGRTNEHKRDAGVIAYTYTPQGIRPSRLS